MIHALVTGDTHGPQRALPDWLLSLAARADIILHTGDLCDLDTFSILASLAPTLAVRGNNDHLHLPDHLLLRLEGVLVGMAHGDVGRGETTKLKAISRVPEAAVVLFGHSHQPGIWHNEDRLVLNPGSPTKPRRSSPCAAWLDLNEGKVGARLVQPEDV